MRCHHEGLLGVWQVSIEVLRARCQCKVTKSDDCVQLGLRFKLLVLKDFTQ